MVEAHVNLSALRHNAAIARQLAPRSRLMAVIKANAYGHGLVRVAQALSQSVDGLAVARWEEALELRRNGIHCRLLVLSSRLSDAQFKHAADEAIDLVIHDADSARRLRNSQLPRAVTAWLKVDTGMHRLGLEPDQAVAIAAQLRQSDAVDGIILMSHFASADEPGNPFTRQQLARLDQINAALHAPVSIANSAAIIGHADSHRDWIRPGIMLYGANPLGETAAPQLRTVMTLRSHLLAVRSIAAGDWVGYNQTWQSPQPTRIGTVAAGYGDGYPRHARSGTPVLVNGRRVPLVGRVSMDMLAVDLGPGSVDNAGDEVTLWGDALPVNEIAACADTISYQLLTAVTARVPIRYHE